MSPYLALIAPLGAGIVVGVSAWLLLGRSRGDGFAPSARSCDHCGSVVLDGWRLCPECGEFIDGTAGSDVPPSAGVSISG